MRSLRVQLVLCLAAAAAIRVAAYHVGPLQHADLRALETMRLSWGVPFRAARSLVALFDPLPYAVLLVLLLVAATLRARLAAGVVAACVVLGASVTTQMLKVLLAEHRPLAADSPLPPTAWPSGHTTAAAALAIALVLVTPPGRRRPVAIAGAVGTAAVGIALVAIGSHYPSDVLGALCVAAAWGAVGWRALEHRGVRSG